MRGDVFGFLGPNGSGKTTTLRMLLGLIRPTAGRAVSFGMDVAQQVPSILPRIGAIVETPVFYPYLSGVDNLHVVGAASGMVSGKANQRRIDEVLELVELYTQAKMAYRKYSLGMKQRLGIAAALLTDPELVLLDEPTNGLDPAGMVEVRALIGQLAQRGTTVFLCSHLLHEVQQVCTRVAILKDGALLAQGHVSELLASGSGVQIAFATPDDMSRAVQALQAAQAGGASWLSGARYIPPDPGAAPPPGGWYLLVHTAAEHASDVNRLLAEQGLYAAEVRRREASLEQFFLALTGAYPAPTGLPVPAAGPAPTAP